MFATARSSAGRPLLPSLSMPPVPLDEGARDRRRVGPFWIEEGFGLLAAGAAILAVVAVLYVVAVLLRPA